MNRPIHKTALLIVASLGFAGGAVWFINHTGSPHMTPQTPSIMSDTTDLAKQREGIALAAIREAYLSTDDEDPVRLFVSHHLDEIEGAYWKQHLGDESPEPVRVLEIIQLRDHWGGDDELDTFDFTLPDEVTQYVISVRFSESGEIEEISMES